VENSCYLVIAPISLFNDLYIVRSANASSICAAAAASSSVLIGRVDALRLGETQKIEQGIPTDKSRRRGCQHILVRQNQLCTESSDSQTLSSKNNAIVLTAAI
jgi:hypothetical protein